MKFKAAMTRRRRVRTLREREESVRTQSDSACEYGNHRPMSEVPMSREACRGSGIQSFYKPSYWACRLHAASAGWKVARSLRTLPAEYYVMHISTNFFRIAA